MRKVYLHLGLPKTGTTTLQVAHFPYYQNVRYLGKFEENMSVLGHCFKPDPLSEFYSFCLHGIRDESLVFKNFSEHLTQTEIDRYDLIDQNVPILISEECFISSFFNPVKRNERYGYSRPEIDSFLLRIKRFFDSYQYSLQLIIVTRSPRDLLLSMYLEYQWDHKKNLQRFIEQIVKSKEMQNAYSISLFSSDFWKQKCLQHRLGLTVFDFQDIFSNRALESFFRETLAFEKTAILNKSITKKRIRQKSYFQIALSIAKLLLKTSISLAKDIRNELRFNRENSEFQELFHRLKNSVDLDSQLNNIVDSS